MLTAPISSLTSSWAWPPEYPSKVDWMVWAAFLLNSPCTIHGSMAPTLGPWQHAPHRLDFIPFDPSINTAFLPGHSTYWHTFKSNTTWPLHSTHWLTFGSLQITAPPLMDLAQVDHKSDTTLLISRYAGKMDASPFPSLPWLIKSAHFPEHRRQIAQAIQHGSTVAICNGSYMPNTFPQLAAAAWIIHPGPNSLATPCHSIMQVHGDPCSVNSYRAELQGLHALITAIRHICMTHQIMSGLIAIGCNNKGVIYQMHHPRPYVPCLYKHVDLLWAIFGLLWQCPIKFSFCYVAGHQDDFTRFDDLPLLAQLNVQANTLAKQALQVLGHQATPLLILPPPGLQWELLIQSLPISSYPHAAILDHLSSKSAISHWISKGQLLPQAAALVDWTLLEFALKPCPPTFKMWLSKFASGHSAVGKMMALWQCWESQLCLLCHLLEETTCHMVQCSNAARVSHWYQLLEEFCLWLTMADMHPDIIHCLLVMLQGQG